MFAHLSPRTPCIPQAWSKIVCLSLIGPLPVLDVPLSTQAASRPIRAEDGTFVSGSDIIWIGTEYNFLLLQQDGTPETYYQ